MTDHATEAAERIVDFVEWTRLQRATEIIQEAIDRAKKEPYPPTVTSTAGECKFVTYVDLAEERRKVLREAAGVLNQLGSYSQAGHEACWIKREETRDAILALGKEKKDGG